MSHSFYYNLKYIFAGEVPLHQPGGAREPVKLSVEHGGLSEERAESDQPEQAAARQARAEDQREGGDQQAKELVLQLWEKQDSDLARAWVGGLCPEDEREQRKQTKLHLRPYGASYIARQSNSSVPQPSVQDNLA